jgi:hypothetical protein
LAAPVATASAQEAFSDFLSCTTVAWMPLDRMKWWKSRSSIWGFSSSLLVSVFTEERSIARLRCWVLAEYLGRLGRLPPRPRARAYDSITQTVHSSDSWKEIDIRTLCCLLSAVGHNSGAQKSTESSSAASGMSHWMQRVRDPTAQEIGRERKTFQRKTLAHFCTTNCAYHPY